MAVLGHNGSGKSTFAKHLNALVTPSEGTIFVDGMDTKNDELVWKREIGFHFICYSPEDKGYIACVHQFPEGGNYTSDEAFKNQWDAVEWIQGEEDSGEEVE